MRMMLFNCHHAVPETTLTTGMFATLVSGLADAADGSYLGDLGGLHIAERNEHSEMRQQYFVWKNLLGRYDHVGFEHYRRLFFLDPLPDLEAAAYHPVVHRLRAAFRRDQYLPRIDLNTADFRAYVAMRAGLDAATQARLQDWIAAHDVIVQRPLLPGPLDAQWQTTHMAELWGPLRHAVEHNSYFRRKPFNIDFSLNAGAYCNMYMMRSELFDEYMRFWEEAIETVAAQVTVYQRLLGHFAERFFSYYLMQKRMEYPLLRVAEVPHVFYDPKLA